MFGNEFRSGKTKVLNPSGLNMAAVRLIQELHRPAVWVKTLVWCWGSHSRGLKFVISVQANDWVGAIPVFSRKSIKAHKTLTLSGVYLAYFRQGKGKYSVTSRLNFDCVGIKTMK